VVFYGKNYGVPGKIENFCGVKKNIEEDDYFFSGIVLIA